MARGDENGGNSGDGAQPKRDRIAALDEQIRQLQARRDGLKAAAAAKERKRDTRRKILLGSQLVKLARDGDDQARALIRARGRGDAGAFARGVRGVGAVSGENCQGAPRSPPAQDEARGDDEALTPSAQIREIDDELVELRRERKKVVAARRRYRSEKQVAARRAARVRHLGAAVLAAPLAAVLVERGARDCGR